MWGPRLTPLKRLLEDAAQDNLLLHVWNVIQPAFLKNGVGFGDNGVDSVCALWLGMERMVLGFVELRRFCDSTPWRCQCANCVRDLEFAEVRC